MQGTTYCANRERNWSVQINFPGKPDRATIDRLKKMGLTFAPSESAWIKRGHWVGSDITAFLAEIGAEKVPDIEREALSFGERLEAKQEAAEERGERLENAAEKAQAEADRRFGTASHMADAIPFGQPILCGHHSEGRDRRYRERIANNMDKGCEAQDKAKELSHRAAASGSQLKGYDNPAFLARRIKETEAEIRRMNRDVEKYPHTANHYAPFLAEEQSKLDFCRERLAELGGVTHSPETVHRGDLVRCNGSMGLVGRVNPKSITVDYLDPRTECLYLLKKVPYEDIKDLTPAADVRQMLEASILANPTTPTALRTRELLDEYGKAKGKAAAAV